jgi:hypothetical protein
MARSRLGKEIYQKKTGKEKIRREKRFYILFHAKKTIGQGRDDALP